ncbi:TetR/AcrR family transcriptional regulator [Myxococcota bacterium]|nr:TetR/AcrR family transcriptional regulator [Myxococcota bacterium]
MITSPRGVGRHHGDLRASLLRAALELLQEGGVEALTLRAVARRAGVSPGAPYHHFADKDALIAAIAGAAFAELHLVLSEAAHGAAAKNAAGRLQAMCAAYVRFALHGPARYAVMFHPDLGQSPAMQTVAGAALAAFEQLNLAVAAVSPRPDPRGQREAALLVWATAHGAVVLQLGGMVRPLTPSLDDTTRLAAQVAAACVGVAACPPLDPPDEPLSQAQDATAQGGDDPAQASVFAEMADSP